MTGEVVEPSIEGIELAPLSEFEVPPGCHPIVVKAAACVLNDNEDNPYLNEEALVVLKESLDELHDSPDLKQAVYDILRMAAVFKTKFDFELGARALCEVAKTATRAVMRQSSHNLSGQAEKKKDRLFQFTGEKNKQADARTAPSVDEKPKAGTRLKDLMPGGPIAGR